VTVRLQNAPKALTVLEDSKMSDAAKRHPRMTMTRADASLESPLDLALSQSVAQFAKDEI